MQILPEGGDNSSWSAVVEFKYNSGTLNYTSTVGNFRGRIFADSWSFAN